MTITRKTYQARQRSRGMVLVLMMLMGVMILIVGLSMIQSCYWARLLALDQGHQLKSRTAADAGVAHALAWMQDKLASEETWDATAFPYTATQTLAGSDAEFSCTIDYNDPGLPDPNDGGFVVDVTGSYDEATRQSHAWLYAGSAWTGISVNTSAVLLAGQWNVTPAGSGIPILHTNATDAGSLVLSPGTVFPGDVVCGTGGDPTGAIQPYDVIRIDGCTYAARRERTHASVTVPSGFPDSSGNLTGGVTLAGGDYTYNSVSMPAWNDVRITGPTRLYVIQDFDLQPFSTLVIEQDESAGTNGSLELYLGGDLDVHFFSRIENQTGDARCLKIYGLPAADQSVALYLASGETYAAIYAPNAWVQLQGFGGFTGAVVADRMSILFAASFTYDTRLRSVSIADRAAEFFVGRWWEDPAS